MLLTISCKLQTDRDQHDRLVKTLIRFNAACNWIAEVAFTQSCSNKVRLQHLVYRQVRLRFGLSSQMAIRAIGKVCESYKQDRAVRSQFHPVGAMPFDERILSWQGTSSISLLTLDGRIRVPILMGEWQRKRLVRPRGQADLVLRGNRFYLLAVQEVVEPAENQGKGFLGVDLGIVNIAADSDGAVFHSHRISQVRLGFLRLRSRLHRANSRSGRRHLKRIGNRAARFTRYTNHCISKSIVSKAKDTDRSIALEDLGGIEWRPPVRRLQRKYRLSWAHGQLRDFIAYKARLAGVRLKLVPSPWTSQKCPRCSNVDKKNRKSRELFRCVGCGFAGFADHIAAINIAARAAVDRPIVPRRIVGPAHLLENKPIPPAF